MIAEAVRRILALVRRRKQPEDDSDAEGHVAISAEPGRNEQFIMDAFGNSGDIVVRQFRLPSGLTILVSHIEGMVDHKRLSDNITARLTIPFTEEVRDAQEVHEALKDHLLVACRVWETDNMAEVLHVLIEGNCAIFVQGCRKALYSNVADFKERAVEEPSTEATIRGSKEGFNENIRTSTSLLRRRIRDPRLWIEEHKIGHISHTRVALAYIKTIAREEVVEEVRRRLGDLQVDSIQESGTLEELIEDAPYSPFPTYMRTERVDRTSGALLEGRIAILVDGTPFALLAPVNLFFFLASPEDYFERWFAGSVLRLFRIAVFFISLVLPSLYVAVTTFHQELLPTTLLLRLAAQREGVPFPAVVEALMMEIVFEVLREAGLRLPRLVGAAVSIVGVLILGETAVGAGLVSSAMIIVVALTAITSFATPAFSIAIPLRLLRFPIMILAGTLGIFGVFWALLALLIHLISLRSLGVPYLEPLAPTVLSELKDTLIRAPWWAMETRPELVAERTHRQPPGQRPAPPEPAEEGDGS